MSGSWASGWAVNDIVTAAEYKKGVGMVADSTLGSAAASIDFAGLPTTYAHMRVAMYARGTAVATTATVTCRMNSDAVAGHYFDVLGQDTDAAHISGGDTATTNTLMNIGSIAAASATASAFSALVMDIPGYASTVGTKSVIAWSYGFLNSGTGNQFVRTAGANWSVSGTAINRLTFGLSSGNFDVGTRCTVYVWGA